MLAGIADVLPIVATVYLGEEQATGCAPGWMMSYSPAMLISNVALSAIAVTLIVNALIEFRERGRADAPHGPKANEKIRTFTPTLLQRKLPHHLGYDHLGQGAGPLRRGHHAHGVSHGIDRAGRCNWRFGADQRTSGASLLVDQPFPRRADKQRSERPGAGYGLWPESSRGAQFSKGGSGGRAGTNGKSWRNFLGVTLACGAGAIPTQQETSLGFGRFAARSSWKLTSHPAANVSDTRHDTDWILDLGSDQGSSAAAQATPAPAGGTRWKSRTWTPTATL